MRGRVWSRLQRISIPWLEGRTNLPHVSHPQPNGHAMTFPIGARVCVDGRDEAIVKQVFANGSWAFLWPHYKVDFVDGDENVAVTMNRVGVDPAKVEDES